MHVPVDALQVGAFVNGASGQCLRVVGFQHHGAQETWVIDLCAGEAKLSVTAQHRVVKDTDGMPGVVHAESLQVGDSVLVTGGRSIKLDGVFPRAAHVEVFEVSFDPDEPVEAFLQPPLQILTLGGARRQARIRRSGMNRRLKLKPCRNDDGDDGVNSLPGTFDSYF